MLSCYKIPYNLMTLMVYSRCAVKADFHCRVIFMYVRAHVNLTRLNKIEATYKVSRLRVKLSKVQLLRSLATFHTLPLFYLFT